MSRKKNILSSTASHAIPLAIALVAGIYAWPSAAKRSSADPATGRMPRPVGVSRDLGSGDILPTAESRRLERFSANEAQDSRVANIAEKYRQTAPFVRTEELMPLLDRTADQDVTFHLSGIEFKGTLRSIQKEQGITQLAVDLADGLGRFQWVYREDSKSLGALFFDGEELAYRFQGKSRNGGWKLEPSSVSQILCSPSGSTYPITRNRMMMPLAPKAATNEADSEQTEVSGGTVKLSSDPESKFVVYLDFDGETVTHPWWTGDETLEAEPHERANDSAFVTRVWRRVCEDFAAFDLNITTDRQVFENAEIYRRVMCVVTPTGDVAPGAGGVAYLTTFGMNVPCWAFNPDEGSCADTISHEVGHTLGLLHDGKINVFEYYGGHGTGQTSWAPIMGAYFADFDPPYVEESVTSWSKGEYPDATNTEDDLEIITTDNGFGYRDDDHGNNAQTASDLQFNGSLVSDRGIIGTNTDADWFLFSTSGGPLQLRADVLDVQSPDHDPGGANLAVDIALIDRTGKILAKSDETHILDAQIHTSVPSGVYYLRVKGAGRGSLATGFTRYAALGQYQLSGSVSRRNVVGVSPSRIELTATAQSDSFSVDENGSWSWSCDQDWVKIPISHDQQGSREVSFSVERNGSKNSREAIILITAGDHIARVHVQQNGVVEYDDHADEFEGATELAKFSSMDGSLEVAGDVDTFVIAVDEPGNLLLRSEGETDVRATLYDANGRKLATSDDIKGPNFRIRRLVPDGIYYLQVSHSEDDGFGDYQVISTFSNSDLFLVDDLETSVGPSGGNFAFDIYASGAWSWETSDRWISSSMKPSQKDGALFGFRVQANPDNKKRKGTIRIYNDKVSVLHVVTQESRGADDHGDVIAQATPIRMGKTVDGRIGHQRDIDVFRISTAKSGQLVIRSYLDSDLKGRLLDANGHELDSNDDSEGGNFRIQHEVSAGDYFLEVEHFDPAGVGNYRLGTSFRHSDLVNLDFRAGKGGQVRGPRSQTVEFGKDARSVKALPRKGYRFTGWSDGVKTERRNDRKVVSHMRVLAMFEPLLSIRGGKSDYVDGSAKYVLDFGEVSARGSGVKTIRLKNYGSRTLSRFRVREASVNPSLWRVDGIRGLRLKPGESAEIRVHFSATKDLGSQKAQYRISALGLTKAVRLNARALVVEPEGSVQGSLALQSAPDSGPAPMDSLVVPAGGALDEWIEVSQDGYFRYRFNRPSGDSGESSFEISSDGVLWEEALVLDVWKTHEDQEKVSYEAILAPPMVPAIRVLVHEGAPQP